MARTIARPLCASPRCRIRDRHKPSCEGNCGGCLPRTTADGLELCQPCTDGIDESAQLCAQVFEELGRKLSSTSAPGEKTSGSPSHNAPFNDLAADLREQIRRGLLELMLRVNRVRGTRPRSETVPDLAAYIATHHDWIAARDYAGTAAADLFELAHGRTFAVAYPTGTRLFQIRTPGGLPAGCPADIEGKPCPGFLWTFVRDADSKLPSELACDGDEGHRFPAADWRALFKTLRQRAGMEAT